MFELFPHNFKWELVLDDNIYLVFDKIRDAFEKSTKEGREKISLNEDGAILFDGKIVPYEILPVLFSYAFDVKTINELYLDKNRPPGIRYDIQVGADKLTYVVNQDNTEEFLVNNRLHCMAGPARFNERKELKEYYRNGLLHRLDGPAKILGKSKIYSLEDEKLTLFDFVRKNPNSTLFIGLRGEKTYRISRWKEYAAIEGIDGTRALLKKGEEGIDNFLISMVANNLPDYKVIYYTKIGEDLKPVYDLISHSNWSLDNSTKDEIEISSKKSYIDRLKFNIKNKEILISSSSDKTSYKKKITYDEEHTYKPHSLIEKLDKNRKRHCANGPAVITPDGEEKYYIHGYRISKEAFNRKKYIKKDKCYIWTDEKGRPHNSEWSPSMIFENGEVRYYKHGLLHSDLFPSVENSQEKIYDYYIYGNKVSYDEFIRYRAALKEIAFLDTEGEFHRENGPARLLFNEDGTFRRENWIHGSLHDENMPAVLDGNGSFEYRKNGFLHRENGPARWDAESNKIEFWLNGKLHNESGPAVLYEENGKRYCEYWVNGEKKAVVRILDEERDLRLNASQIQEIINKNKTLFNNKDKLISKGVNMHVKKIKHGTANSTVGDSRKTQVLRGAELGLKKGTVRVISEKASSALVSSANLPDHKATERLIQVAGLLGTAELIERSPDRVASKVGLNQDRRESFGGLCRYLAGEVIGKDAVHIVASIAPKIVDALQTLSVEDIEEAAETFTVEAQQTEPALA